MSQRSAASRGAAVPGDAAAIRDGPGRAGSAVPRLLLAGLLLGLLAATVARPAAAQSPADSAWTAGDIDRARALYAERLAADSSDAEALHRLTLIHGWNGDYDRSLALVDRLLEVAPSRDARLLRARVLSWTGRYGEARTIYETALADDPDHVEALIGLGRVLRWEGRYDEAARHLRRALEIDPERADAREELQRIDRALGPTVAPRLAYERDSDGNDIFTVSGYAAWRPAAGAELRVDAYRRGAALDVVAPEVRWTTGVTLTGSLRVGPGWRLYGSVGGALPDAAGVDPVGAYALAVVTPGGEAVQAALRLGREPVDYSAVLIANRTVRDRLSLELSAQPGAWAVDGDASVAWYQTLTTGARSRRLAAEARATRPVLSWLELGGRLQVFGFDRDVDQGYFDPQLYALLAAPATASAGLYGPVEASVTVAPGLQRIRARDVGPALETRAGLAWHGGPDREAALRLVYARNGASPFAADAVDYRYLALVLEGRWAF